MATGAGGIAAQGGSCGRGAMRGGGGDGDGARGYVEVCEAYAEGSHWLILDGRCLRSIGVGGSHDGEE